MSHITTLQLKISDIEALRAACRENNISPPEEFHAGEVVKVYTVDFKDGGYRVALPNWRYPLMIARDGTVSYDNFNGVWGDEEPLQLLLQSYVVEAVRRRAKAHRYKASSRRTGDEVRIVLTEI